MYDAIELSSTFEFDEQWPRTDRGGQHEPAPCRVAPADDFVESGSELEAMQDAVREQCDRYRAHVEAYGAKLLDVAPTLTHSWHADARSFKGRATRWHVSGMFHYGDFRTVHHNVMADTLDGAFDAAVAAFDQAARMSGKGLVTAGVAESAVA